jgi:predicted dehydrogenase
MSILRVGIIGAGDIAEKHLEVLSSFADVEVVALSSRGHPRVHDLANRFRVNQTFTDYRAMLETPALDAVFVLVSAVNVATVSGDCLRHGVPTFIEKPPGFSVAETQGLLQIARTNGCLNMVGLNRRFYSVIRKAREAILEAGGLVSIMVEAPENLAAIKALGFHPQKVIKGWMFANSVHCIDLLRFFGGDIKTICSLTSQWHEEQQNSFGALMRFESGAIGQYFSNWMAPGRWNVILFGRGRRIVLNPLERGTVIDQSGENRTIEPEEVDLRFKPGFYAQDRYFLDCVKHKQPVSAPAADLAEAVLTMDLVERIAGGDLTLLGEP